MVEKNWKSIIVSEEIRLIDAIKVLNNTGLLMLIVTNKSLKLKATITDGDIRKGLAKGITLEDKINLVMKLNPKYVTLKTNYKYPIDNPEAVNAACNFKQEIRHKYLVDWVYQIPLKEIRTDWKLKSTYFSISEKEDVLTFNGKGFGHGVGLSQEGAMKMIDLGYDFLDVLRFYYTDVHLINLSMRDFYLID